MKSHSIRIWSHRTVWWQRFLIGFDGSADFFQSIDHQSNVHDPMSVSLRWPHMHCAVSISIVIDLCHLCYILLFHSPNNVTHPPTDMFCHYYYCCCCCCFVCTCPFSVCRSTNDPSPLSLMAAVRLFVTAMLRTSADVAVAL